MSSVVTNMIKKFGVSRFEGVTTSSEQCVRICRRQNGRLFTAFLTCFFKGNWIFYFLLYDCCVLSCSQHLTHTHFQTCRPHTNTHTHSAAASTLPVTLMSAQTSVHHSENERTPLLLFLLMWMFPLPNTFTAFQTLSVILSLPPSLFLSLLFHQFGPVSQLVSVECIPPAGGDVLFVEACHSLPHQRRLFYKL